MRIYVNNYTVWLNPSPQSYRFCRPLRIQYRKETSELVLQEKANVENEIKSLSPATTSTSDKKNISATTNFVLCLIDGKIVNIISHTNSSLKCPICKQPASKFNNLQIMLKTPIMDKENLMHGISPLHAWIRVLEFLLHLGYKNDPLVQTWRVKKKSPQGEIVNTRKTNIQIEIREKIGLLVDVVKPNSGTTNDGNTARTLLSDKNRATFAEILGIEQWLLDDLFIILVALSCGLPIDATKFGDFCKCVASKYVATYSWHPMTVTIHKILIHGQQIIQSSNLPIGMLSEQSAESRNKYWRSDREHHTRKCSREKTMLDLFQRALLTSDPKISSIGAQNRKKNTKSIPLPAQVIAMLSKT